MMQWDRDADVSSYAYEPDVIDLGDGRHAIPDFQVTYADGRRVYVEIKPSAIQALPSVAERLARVKDQIERRGDSYIVFGNREIDAFKAALGEEFNDAIERYKGGS
jgi:hypothetical protein